MDIQNFIAEFKKTFVYDLLSMTLKDEQLFEHFVDGDKVIWFKEQTRQMWEMWQQAQKVAVPDGFVLVEKNELRDTYYWDGCEYVVDHPCDYEMELEQGEIITLEKWQRTKSTNVYFSNIYTDEDNFDIVQFDSFEEAEKAVAANKAMIEAQEPTND